jgi:hypothetical protein
MAAITDLKPNPNLAQSRQGAKVTPLRLGGFVRDSDACAFHRERHNCYTAAMIASSTSAGIPALRSAK